MLQAGMERGGNGGHVRRLDPPSTTNGTQRGDNVRNVRRNLKVTAC